MVFSKWVMHVIWFEELRLTFSSVPNDSITKLIKEKHLYGHIVKVPIVNSMNTNYFGILYDEWNVQCYWIYS